MDVLNRRNFIQKLSGAGMVLPFAGPLDLFNRPQAGSTVHVFSKHLQFLDYANLAAAAAEMGFDGIDLSVRRGGHVLPENVATDLPKAVAAIKQKGLQAIMMSTNVSNAADAVNRRVLQTAASLGVKYFRPDWLRFPAESSLPDALKRYEQQMISLATFAASLGISGSYQNHSGNYVGSFLWELYEMIKSADKKGMGCQFDILHAVIEGGLSWQQSLKLMLPYINTIVVKDFRWEKVDGKWIVRYVPLGEGMVDFPTYFSLLARYGLRVPISLHFEYPLGGAENGAAQLTVDQKLVFDAMKKDLTQLRTWLKAAGLG